MSAFLRVAETLCRLHPGRRRLSSQPMTDDEYENADDMSSVLMYVAGFIGLGVAVFWLTQPTGLDLNSFRTSPATTPPPAALSPARAGKREERTVPVPEPAASLSPAPLTGLFEYPGSERHSHRRWSAAMRHSHSTPSEAVPVAVPAAAAPRPAIEPATGIIIQPLSR